MLSSKYFRPDDVTRYVINISGKFYNFYDLKQICDTGIEDLFIIRTVAENSFNIYNHFAKQIGVAIPRTRRNPRKKLVDRL